MNFIVIDRSILIISRDNKYNRRAVKMEQKSQFRIEMGSVTVNTYDKELFLKSS